jgi:hypothetical protein
MKGGDYYPKGRKHRKSSWPGKIAKRVFALDDPATTSFLP